MECSDRVDAPHIVLFCRSSSRSRLTVGLVRYKFTRRLTDRKVLQQRLIGGQKMCSKSQLHTLMEKLNVVRSNIDMKSASLSARNQIVAQHTLRSINRIIGGQVSIYTFWVGPCTVMWGADRASRGRRVVDSMVLCFLPQMTMTTRCSLGRPNRKCCDESASSETGVRTVVSLRVV